VTLVDVRTIPERAPFTELGPVELPREEPRRIPRRRIYAFCALMLLLVAAGYVHARGMSHSPIRIDDEGTYVAQAYWVQTGRGLAHYTYWYDHPQLGWIQIAAWTGLTDAFERAPNAVAAGREAMLVAKLASCALVYILARRLRMRVPFALAAVALLAFNPLALDFQRRVFLDNVATPWLLGAFVLALSPQRRLSAAAGAALCFGMAALSKETVLVVLPAFVYVLWQHGDQRNRKFIVTLALVATAIVIGAYPLYAILNGELFPGAGHVSLLASARWQLFERPSSGSLLDPASNARNLLRNWLSYDGWLLLATTVSLPIGLASRRLRGIALVVFIQVAILLRGGYVPYPYVIAVLPFAALLVAGVADALWGVRGAHLPSWLGTRAGRWAWIPAWCALFTAAAFTAFAVAPAWAHHLDAEMTQDRDAPMRRAQEWVAANVPHDDVIVVDDALWLDLFLDGRDHNDVIWFYKLDLDPAVKLAHGWRSIDYLVLTDFDPQVAGAPKLVEAVQHSRVVESYGKGPEQVSVYEVQK
jgi:hypothetical protein